MIVEQEIEEDSYLFKSLINQSSDAICVIKPETGSFLFVNDRMCNILGYTRNELMSMDMTGVEAITAAEFSCKELLRRVREQRYVTSECEIKRKDGTTLSAEVNARLEDYRQKEYLLVIIRDITEKKNAEDALREVNTRLHVLIHAIPDIVYFKDTKLRNLVINKSFEDLVGRSKAEIIGKTDDHLFPLELAVYCRRSDREVIRTGRTIKSEEAYTNKEGKRIFFETIKSPVYDTNGNIIGLIGISRDITDRKLSEEETLERKKADDASRK